MSFKLNFKFNDEMIGWKITRVGMEKRKVADNTSNNRSSILPAIVCWAKYEL